MRRLHFIDENVLEKWKVTFFKACMTVSLDCVSRWLRNNKYINQSLNPIPDTSSKTLVNSGVR